MSVMVSVTIKKFDLLSDFASIPAIKTGVQELNTQETLIWTKMKLPDAGWTSDVDVFNMVEKNLGQEYSWNPSLNIGGGTLHTKSPLIVLARNESKRHEVGSWN